MGFYHNYVALCREISMSPSAAAEAMGFKRSIVTRWAKGSIPHKSTLHTISDFFDVPVDFLLSDKEKAAPLEGAGITKAQQTLIKLIASLSDQEIAVLASTAKALIASRKSQGDS